ncbi:hypothetical protein TanjilG_32871 [Lupinus angustifolius]|uniref:Major facilitator superfamily (MFS) profile domain-containing protein n=1 Tax=Lupinus angustifolius TaxID=3871 RepID=A0A4P1RPW7_LUPAN|nr:hypothetical protein TanjilG_32871 [Lupinus angustifolius]
MSAMTSSVSDNQAHDKKTLPPLSSPPENVCIDDVAASLPSGSGDKDHGHSPPQEKICMDDMLQKYCGEFGRWQQRQFILVSLAWILEAFHSMVMIFADHEPTWRCLSGSAGSGCSTTATSVCHLKPGSWEWVGGRNRSTVSEWGLICGGKFKVGLVQALFFVGCTIGAGIFGHLSDSFLGRKGSLIVACILNTIFGCLTALSPKYWVYALFRTLTGFTVSGVGINVFALANEPVGPSKRGVAGMSTFYFFPSGVAILSAIAYFFQKWRHLYIASSIPSILFVFFVIPFISESPRWYLVRGKINEAMKLMSTIASTNGKHLPSNVILVLDQELASIPNDGKEESFIPNGSKETSPKPNGGKEASSISNDSKETLPKPNRGKEASSIPNDGKETTSITNEGSGTKETAKNKIFENKDAISASILDVIRSPATRISQSLPKCGSKFTVRVTSILDNNIVVKQVREKAVSSRDNVVQRILLLNREFDEESWCMEGGEDELFPTVVRNVSLGCSAQASQMGAILAPFVVVLGGWMPFGVFAACGIFGGVFTIFLPETLNKPLYDTIAGLEASIV